MSELGRVRWPYGGFVYCGNDRCRKKLSEEPACGGAFLMSDAETSKLTVVCGGCSVMLPATEPLRFAVVRL